MNSLFIRRRCLALPAMLAFATSFSLCLPRISAHAQETSTSSEAVEPAPQVVYEKKTVLDFSDVTLEGELSRPEGSYLLNRKKARFGSLVQLRTDFLPELQKSVDNL